MHPVLWLICWRDEGQKFGLRMYIVTAKQMGWLSLSCSFSKLAPIGATLPIFLIWTISSLLRHSIRLEYVPTLPPNQPPRA